MTADVESYRQALIVALRLRDVPGDRIADALAQVDSHVAESGEDPAEAFGPPKEYAATVADAFDPTRPRGWRAVLDALSNWTVPAGFMGGFLLADGLFNLGAGTDAVFGLPAVPTILMGIVLAVAVAFRVRTRERDRLIDPRTGKEVSFGPDSRWAKAAVYAVPIVALAAPYVAGQLLSGS